MAKKLYVGGVSYSTTEQGLEEAFAKFGKVVSATIIIDKMTNRSRGFGFVEIEDEAAEAAINAMNGATLDGRRLIVNVQSLWFLENNTSEHQAWAKIDSNTNI